MTVRSVRSGISTVTAHRVPMYSVTSTRSPVESVKVKVREPAKRR